MLMLMMMLLLLLWVEKLQWRLTKACWVDGLEEIRQLRAQQTAVHGVVVGSAERSAGIIIRGWILAAVHHQMAR